MKTLLILLALPLLSCTERREVNVEIQPYLPYERIDLLGQWLEYTETPIEHLALWDFDDSLVYVHQIRGAFPSSYEILTSDTGYYIYIEPELNEGNGMYVILPREDLSNPCASYLCREILVFQGVTTVDDGGFKVFYYQSGCLKREKHINYRFERIR